MNASRQSPRKVINRVVNIQMEPNIQAIVQNISDEGLCFHALAPITQLGTIRFSFAENGHRTEAIGELVWIDQAKKTGGLRFTSMTLASRERIRNWMDQAAALPSMGAPSEPAPPRPRITPPPALDPVQLDPAPRAYVPPPGMPVIQPTMPGFALLEGETQPMPYTWEQEMARQDYRQYRPKFFQGFVTGAFFTAVLAGIALFAYGNPAAVLEQWRAITNATSPARTMTDTPPPAAVTPAPTAQALPPSGSTEAHAAPAPVPEPAGDPSTNSAAVPPPTGTPSADNHAASAPAGPPPSVAPKAADNGDAEFAMAERYLREKSGPGSSAAAANSLWAAVKKGNVSAEITLADLYARGDGVTKNCDQARVLLRAAAEKGSSIASQQLAQVVRSGCR
jgi:PilZ domain